MRTVGDVEGGGGAEDFDLRWFEAAFDEHEFAAVTAPSTASAIDDDRAPILVVGEDGSLELACSADARRAWQDAVFAAAAAVDPFHRWTLVDTVSRWRGVVDQTAGSPVGGRTLGAAPDPRYRCVRRARGVDDLATLDAAINRDDVDGWLAERVGRLGRVSRYLHELWLGRPDLHGVFPRVGDRDDSTTGFLSWVLEFGCTEHDIPEPFLPSTQELSPSVVSETPTRRGVRVAGHGAITNGVGESARRMIAALERTDHPVHWYTDPVACDLDTNVLCMNLDEVEQFAHDMGGSYFEARHTIVMPYWEVDGKPPGLDAAAAFADELWVASEFVAQALRPHVEIPVRVVPLPVVQHAKPGQVTRRATPFTYGFIFDFNSSMERKQPLALVRAYSAAYPVPDGTTRLVLKSINGAANPRDLSRLRDAVADRDDIELQDGFVPADERDALMSSFDCYVSLHRSEGFGLTIAEALLAEVPVIATGYGGNVEFAGSDCASLVKHHVVPVSDEHGPYRGIRGAWAQPDEEHAAELMLDVRRNLDEARRRAAIGRARLQRTHSLDTAAAWIERQLTRRYSSSRSAARAGIRARWRGRLRREP